MDELLPYAAPLKVRTFGSAESFVRMAVPFAVNKRPG
jgi:hypothetical protein